MPSNRRFQLRAFISIYMVASGLVLTLTGIICYIKPPGRIASWIDWRILGLSKGSWEAVHTIFAFLLVVAIVIHVYLNWSFFWEYIWSKLEKGLNKKFELSLAILLTVVFFALTILGISPFKTVVKVGDKLSEGWGSQGRTPPIARVETYSLSTFCRLLELDSEEAMTKLEAAGLRGVDSLRVVSDIAGENNMPPLEIGRILDVDIVK